MKTKILFLMVLIVMSVMAFGCGGKDSADFGGSGKVTVGLDDNFPPFGFRDERGNIVGFDVDLAKEVMRRLDKEVEFKTIDWSNKEEELEKGNVDMIWNGLEITDERRRYMMFSRPYMRSGFIIFIRHTDQPNLFTGKNMLSGKTVGIQRGSTVEMHVNDDNDLRFTIKELKLYDAYPEAFMDLVAEKLDAVICDETNGRYYIFQHNLKDKIDPLDIPIGEKGNLAIGFAKNNNTLREEVQEAFDSMIKDGTTKKISTQWFGKDLIIEDQ